MSASASAAPETAQLPRRPGLARPLGAIAKELASPAEAFAAFRRQETTLILLNLGLLSALALIHVLFFSFLGTPSQMLMGLFAGRFLMQTLEAVALQAIRRPPGAAVVGAYARLSVWMHVAFAAAVAVLSQFDHGHYVVLLILPTISAVFRFSVPGTVAVLVAVTATTFFQVAISFEDNATLRIAEFFEAATVSLIYVFVAAVVWLLVRQSRLDQVQLQSSLENLRLTRDRLIQEEKLAAVGRLAGAVAHEIRNPVAMISSAVAMAKNGGLEQAVRSGMCEMVAREAGRLERITSDFLAYARQKPPELRPAPVAGILDYVTALIRPHAEQRNVRLEFAAPADADVLVEPFQIHQALLNLGMNAVDACGDGGLVALSGGIGTDGTVAFCVRNSGAPIPEDVVQRLFEPFFTTKPAGTGLGLPISRKIAEAHGGTLVLERNEPNNVEFVLTVPDGAAAQPVCASDTDGQNPDR